mgnify:CR=1 FL=1
MIFYCYTFSTTSIIPMLVDSPVAQTEGISDIIWLIEIFKGLKTFKNLKIISLFQFIEDKNERLKKIPQINWHLICQMDSAKLFGKAKIGIMILSAGVPDHEWGRVC